MDWKIPYTIKKILRRRCLKWACMIHLNNYNISCGQKKGWESKYQFDFRPLKVGNRPELHVYRWHATYCWKFVNESYNFTFDLASIGSLHKKLWASNKAIVSIMGISRLPTWESQDKMTFGCYPRGQSQKILWGGKVVASPKSASWWVLWIRVCPWFIHAPKVFQLCNNQLVVWVV